MRNRRRANVSAGTDGSAWRKDVMEGYSKVGREREGGYGVRKPEKANVLS